MRDRFVGLVLVQHPGRNTSRPTPRPVLAKASPMLSGSWPDEYMMSVKGPLTRLY